jgi:hypothetical protein
MYLRRTKEHIAPKTLSMLAWRHAFLSTCCRDISHFQISLSTGDTHILARWVTAIGVNTSREYLQEDQPPAYASLASIAADVAERNLDCNNPGIEEDVRNS